MSQAAARLMVESKVTNGSIVNLASISGKVGHANMCTYAYNCMGCMSTGGKLMPVIQEN